MWKVLAFFSENDNRLLCLSLPSLISLFGFNRRVVALGQRTSSSPPLSSADTHAPSAHCVNNRLFRLTTVACRMARLLASLQRQGEPPPRQREHRPRGHLLAFRRLQNCLRRSLGGAPDWSCRSLGGAPDCWRRSVGGAPDSRLDFLPGAGSRA